LRKNQSHDQKGRPPKKLPGSKRKNVNSPIETQRRFEEQSRPAQSASSRRTLRKYSEDGWGVEEEGFPLPLAVVVNRPEQKAR
jgi:hypothetical protein